MTSSMRSADDVRAELEDIESMLKFVSVHGGSSTRISLARAALALEWVLDGTDFDELADWNDATEINF